MTIYATTHSMFRIRTAKCLIASLSLFSALSVHAIPLTPLSENVTVVGEAGAGTDPGTRFAREITAVDPLAEASSLALNGDSAFAAAAYDGASQYSTASEAASFNGLAAANVALLSSSVYDLQSGLFRLDIELTSMAVILGQLASSVTELLFSLSDTNGLLASDSLLLDGTRDGTQSISNLFASNGGGLATLELSLLDSSSAEFGGSANAINSVRFAITPVPEPPAPLLVLAGCAALLGFARRSKGRIRC